MEGIRDLRAGLLVSIMVFGVVASDPLLYLSLPRID